MAQDLVRRDIQMFCSNVIGWDRMQHFISAATSKADQTKFSSSQVSQPEWDSVPA